MKPTSESMKSRCEHFVDRKRLTQRFRPRVMSDSFVGRNLCAFMFDATRLVIRCTRPSAVVAVIIPP